MGFKSNETAAKCCPSHKVQEDYLQKDTQANNFRSLEIFVVAEHNRQNCARSKQ
jgi:hypothetical protein